MKALYGALAGMGVLGIIFVVCIPFFAIAMSLYGLYLAFSASVILGIVVFFVEPSPLVIGLVMFFFHKNLAEAIMQWLNN